MCVCVLCKCIYMCVCVYIHTFTIPPSNPLLDVYQGNKDICPQKSLYTNVDGSISHNSQKLETCQISMNR